MPAAAIPQGLLEIATGRPALAAAHHGRVAVHLLDNDVARGAPLHVGWELNIVHGQAAREDYNAHSARAFYAREFFRARAC